MNSTVAIFLVATVGMVAFAGGLATGSARFAGEYRMGWNAGYDAREQQAQDDNARFAGAGLCTLASFSCETFLHPKGKHK